MTQIQPEFVYPAVATCCALIGAVYDVKSRRVPNFLTGPAIMLGLLLHLAIGGWHQLIASVAAGLVCGLVFLIFYLAGGMGAGDVKLMTAVGCLAGLSSAAYLLVLTALAGGAMAIVLALMRGRLKETIINVGALALHHGHEGLRPHPVLNIGNVQTLRLPYALAIAAGTAATFCMLLMQVTP